MGGSRGNRGDYGGISGIPIGEVGGVSCINLSFQTNLASVDAKVLATVKEGDIYDVVADSTIGPAYVLVGDARLGTIIHSNDVQLLECIFEGTKYQARVVSIDGGKCSVLVRAKQ